jgi:hypothetical protein
MRFRQEGHRFIYGPEPLERREMLSGDGIIPASRLATHIAATAGSQAHIEQHSSITAGKNAALARGGHRSQTNH